MQNVFPFYELDNKVIIMLLLLMAPSVSFPTDVCSRDNIDEVDLIQLIEEQIPRYVLRADTLTDFAGYQHEDWIHTPCLPPDIDVDLSPELVGETLKYFSE